MDILVLSKVTGHENEKIYDENSLCLNALIQAAMDTVEFVKLK